MKGISIQWIMLSTFRTTMSSNYSKDTLPGNLSLTPLRHFSFIWIGWGVLFQSTFHLRPLLPPYWPSANIKSPYMAYTEQNNWYILALRLAGYSYYRSDVYTLTLQRILRIKGKLWASATCMLHDLITWLTKIAVNNQLMFWKSCLNTWILDNWRQIHQV